MIISISGKINSGKDTVGKIIQYLTLDKEVFSMDTADIVADLSYNGYCANKSDWKIRKFADKLKDITCLLIGCSREQLEDREFKEKELGEEWWYYIIKLNNSKTLIPYLDTKQELKEDTLVKLTPRLLMQLLGTECMRNVIHPNGWANTLMCDYKETAVNWDCDGNTTVKELPKWLITDTRFPNELQAVKDKKGITIRVKRPKSITVKDWDNLCPCCGQNQQEGKDLDNSYNCYKCKSTYKVNFDDKGGRGFDVISIIKDTTIQEHESETALDDAKFDYVIENNYTIEKLIEKVKEILIKENII
jgi:hypothetical protein